MKSYWMMGLSILLLIAFATISVHALEIRGSVAGTVNGASNLIDSFSWSPQNFAGFDYDIDHDVGYETLTTTLTGDNKLSGDEPYGIVYEASDRIKGLSNPHADMKYGKLSVRSIDSTGTIILGSLPIMRC